MKLIYRLFLDGLTFHSIARELTASGVLTPGGKNRWSQKSVESILTNEKYKGDALLQKSFTVNFLTKEKKQNEGEVPRHYEVRGPGEAHKLGIKETNVQKRTPVLLLITKYSDLLEEDNYILCMPNNARKTLQIRKEKRAF